MGDEFVFDWTKKLGFRSNPFTTEIPKKIDRLFAGRGEERRKLNLFILEKYPFGTIQGKEGLGKTTILKWIESQLSKSTSDVKVTYINAEDLKKERDLIRGLTEPLMNIYERKVAKKQEKLPLEKTGKFIYSKLKEGQRLLVLLDDVGGLPDRYISLLSYFFDNKIGVQVIAAGTKKEMKDSDITQVSDKDWLEIELEPLSYEEMASLVKKRISTFGQEQLFPFKEEMIEEMHAESDGNPEEFLELCRERAIKLSLDREYIQDEMDRIHEEKKKVRDQGSEGGLISITLGKTEDEDAEKQEPEEDELLELLDAPEMEEQEKMLKEVDEDEQEEDEPELDLKFEDEPEEDTDEEEEKKKGKEDEKMADETEELLSQLTQDFEED